VLYSASVNALQIVFSNSLYVSTAEWETSQIFKEDTVGLRLAGASVIKMAPLLGVSRAVVSKVISSYTNHRRTSSAKRNSGRKPQLIGKDCHMLKRIVVINQRSTAAKVTAEINIRLKTFPEKQSDKNVTNPTSMVELQLLNL